MHFHKCDFYDYSTKYVRVASHRQFAQVKPTIDPNKLRNFQNAFTYLSDVAKLTIVVEDAPHFNDLSTDKYSKLNEVLRTATSYSGVIVAVADAFDYKVSKAGNNQFILNKRYSNPDDLPDVTLDEAIEYLDRIAEMLEDFYKNHALTGQNENMVSFNDSLTSEQKIKASSGISVLELPQKDRDLILRSFTLPSKYRTKLNSHRLEGA